MSGDPRGDVEGPPLADEPPETDPRAAFLRRRAEQAEEAAETSADAALASSERADAARAEADALRAVIERVRELHRPWHEANGVRRDHLVMVAWDEAPADHVCVITDWDRCAPGDVHYVRACAECRWTSEDGDPVFPLWPCPTIRALDGETPQ